MMPYFLFVWNICFCPCLNREVSKTVGMEGTGLNFWFAFVFSYPMNRNTWSWKRSPAVIGTVCCYYSHALTPFK